MHLLEKRGWSYKKLNDLGFVGRGKSRHRPRNEPSLYGGIYPFVQTGDVKSANLYITNYSQTYNEKGLAQSKLWQPGTLLITIAANIAETAILAIEACFPDSIVGFIADPNESDVRFVKYYIDFIKLQVQNVSRGTTQDNLSVDKLLTFDFFVPEVDEQRRIAAILSAYDDLIENNTRRIQALEQAAHDLYREWFVHFRFPGHENVEMVDSGTDYGMIPHGWGVGTVVDFGKVITGKTPSKKNPNNFGGYMPFIKLPDMHYQIFITDTQDQLSEKGALSQKNKTIPENSICVSCIGTVGIVVIPTRISQTNQQINTIIPKWSIYREYIYFSIIRIRPTMENFASTGATMPNLSKGKFENLPVILPTETLIRNYHEFTAPMFNEIRTLASKNNALREARDLLLPRLVSGQLDVSEIPHP